MRPFQKLPSLLALALALSIFGCSHSTSGSTSGDGSTLQISPDAPVLITDGTHAVSQAFKVNIVHTDGSKDDVTGQATFSLDAPRLGTFAANTFSSDTFGGVAHVKATVGSLNASTLLTVKVRVSYKDPGSDLPGDPGSAFGGPQATSGAGVPDLVYPNDGVMLPPNLSKLEFHFLPGSGNALFEVAFTNAATDLKVYTRCTTSVAGGCVYQPDATVWRWLSESNRGGDPVQVGVRAVNDAVPGSQVGVSGKLSMSFAPDDVNGAIYYWTTTNNKGIMRFAFGSRDATATPFAGVSLTGGTCMGCHALSRDGAKMAAEAGGQNDGRLLLLKVSDTTTLSPFPSGDKSIFESWSPDGSKFVGVYGDKNATDFNLHIQDGVSGQTLQAIAGTGDSTHPADHPDWAPTGDKIVYTRVGAKNTLQKMGLGSIEMVKQVNGAWSAPTKLVPQADGKNRYYPAFAPDGQFIVYDESTCPAGTAPGTYVKTCNADTDPTAKLFALPVTGSGAPVALDRANAPGKADGSNTSLTNSFPKWSPFIGKGKAPGSRLMWITFASTRKFGLKTPPAGGDENPSGTWLWMAAIDPDKVGQGVDPSYPAFYLPYQEAGTSNHIAQWAETLVDHCEVRGGSCQNDSDCCSGLSCSASGELGKTCQAASNSCGVPGAQCTTSDTCCAGLGCLQSNGAACAAGTSCSCTVVFK